MSDAIGSVYANMRQPKADQDTQAKQMYDAFVKADLKTVEQLLRRNKDLVWSNTHVYIWKYIWKDLNS